MSKIKKPLYERIGVLTLEKVFPFIEEHFNNPQKIRVQIDQYFVNVSSLRLKSFLLHGIHCSCCDNQASFFAVERSFNTKAPYHLNLYGLDKDGAEILFTHDHILARGLGGSDTIDNTRTSCGPCNWKKGQLEHLIKNSKNEQEKLFLQEQIQQFFPKTQQNKLKII